jgi:hypothetical protein
MENHSDAGTSRISNTVVRVLAIFGFVAVIVIGMWGAVTLARGVPGAFSNLAAAFVSLTSVFVPAGETITVSAPSLTVQAGTPITLSWTHEKQNAQGSYTFRYDCVDGAYFASPTASGQDATVYCNVPFNFLNSHDSVTLTPFSTKNRFTDVTVYIDFTPNGSSAATVTGKTTLTIENDNFATSPGTTTPTTPSQPATPPTHTLTPGQTTSQTYPLSGGIPVSNPNGSVDLTAKILEVGVVDKSTGQFISSSTPSRSATANSGQYRLAVRFVIENDGTKTSPQFDFNAVLPTLPLYIFSSPMQQALAPGDRIEFTLGFDSFNAAGDGQITVNVDPAGRINELNKTNNIVHYTVVTMP